MIKLEENKHYSVDKSDLLFFVRKINHQDKKIADVTGDLFHKKSGQYYGFGVNFTLDKELINHWNEYKGELK